MALALAVHPLPPPLPKVTWAWNAETRILMGRFPVPAGSGFTGSVEITGDDGAIVVLDARGGWLSGVEIVVWPGAEVDAGLRLPEAVPGRLTIPGATTASGIGAEEVETAMDADVTPNRNRMHILIGEHDADRWVRAADHFVVELDAVGQVAGLWLDAVPPAPGAVA